MVLKNIVNTIAILFYIFVFLVVSYQITNAIFGRTWTTENIIISALGIIITGLFMIAGFLINQGKTLGVLEERTMNVRDSLVRLGDDFKDHLSKEHENN